MTEPISMEELRQMQEAYLANDYWRGDLIESLVVTNDCGFSCVTVVTAGVGRPYGAPKRVLEFVVV